MNTLDNRLRILVVTRNFPPLTGGMERLNHHLVLELAHNHDVFLVGPRGANTQVSFSNQVATCPQFPAHRFLLCATIRATTVARRIRPHLIIAGSGVTAPAAWIAAKWVGTPCIVYLHGLDVVIDHGWYHRLVLPIIRRCTGWMTNSRATAHAAVAAGMDGNRIRLLHPGVSVPDSLPPTSAISTWRSKHGLGKAPIILSVGRLTRRKGLAEFLENAFPRILKEFPDARLVIIGEEPHSALTNSSGALNRVLQAANSHSTSRNLLLLGRLPDDELEIAYSAASVLVFPVLDIPGDMEGFGMVAIEAAAHGLPTVAFNVGGVADAVSDGHSGDLVKAGDYHTLAQRLIARISQGKSRDSVEQCRNFAYRFTWTSFGARLREICANWADDTP